MAYWVIGIVCWAILARMRSKIFKGMAKELCMDDDIIIANHFGHKALAVDLMRSQNEWIAKNPPPDYGFLFHYLAIIAFLPILLVLFVVIVVVFGLGKIAFWRNNLWALRARP